MKKVKKTFLRAFFTIEAIVFIGTYFFGAQGIKAQHRLLALEQQLDDEIVSLQKDIQHLEKHMVAWKTDNFYKEKVARERLHMARKDEVVYYIS